MKSVSVSKKSIPQDKDSVVFVSTDATLDAIDIRVNGRRYRAKQGKDKEFLYWNIPNADVAAFSKHSHVLHGKIVRAD